MFGFLSGFLGKIGLYLFLAVLGLFFFWMILRCLGCTPEKRVRPDPTNNYAVKAVPTGNRIEVEAGVRGRKTKVVILHGIGVPTEDPDLVEQSRANLERLAGEAIHVVVLDGRQHGDAVIEAEVWGEAGANCQIEQLRAGLAWVTDVKRKDYLAAEREAQKAKKGIWQKKRRTSGQLAVGSRQ